MGWPLIEESPQLPDTMPSSVHPRVSIVTPSYNQGQFLETTIRSVLLQGYPDLEYIIIDGGSIDGSVDIIRKYEPWLAYWVSEPDRGQSCAINKGFRKASGDIIAWLNSDDSYLPGAISHAVQSLQETKASVVYSKCRMITGESDLLGFYDPLVPVTLRDLIMLWRHDFACPPQPTVFFRRQALECVGLLDETLHYALDYELWLRMIQYSEFCFVDATWANYVVHPQSKTGKGWLPFVDEAYQAGRRYWHRLGTMDQFICWVAGKRLMISRRYLDHAFDAFYADDWPKARRWLLKAIWMDPSRLSNRGVLSLCRKAWGRHLRSENADTSSGATQRA